ncbi:MAG: hypothetical protein NVSMB59_23320 [Vulcanimicrobiaceae bacterium]
MPDLDHVDSGAGVEAVDNATHLRELHRAALDIARERTDVDRALAAARDQLESARAELPLAERTAKTRRQSQLDAVRGRADLERRLQGLIESEALARTRRQQAEQRAQGFRAAATFAASGRTEGETPDAERIERERLVEARAIREASVAESRATEEHTEELKIGKLRAELEMHVAAEREVEAAFALERETAEKRTAELNDQIARLTIEIEAFEIALEQLTESSEAIAHECSQISAEFDDERRATRESIETRLAELRAIEADAARERAQLETMLADLAASDAEATSQADLAATNGAHERNGVHDAAGGGQAAGGAIGAATATQDGARAAASSEASAKAAEPVKAPLYVARPATAKPAAKVDSFIRPERTPYRPTVPAQTGSQEELIPGFKSLVGNIFARKPRVEPVPDVVEPVEGSSIADRIARDFGLLGGGPETPKP